MKKGVKIFIALLMVLSIAGCGVSTKEYSEIEKIFKDENYEFDVSNDCGYASIKKDNHRWIMIDKSDDLYYRDVDEDGGLGVVNLNDKKLYRVDSIREELTTKEDKKRAEKYLKSSEEKLKKLDLSEKDVLIYVSKKFEKKKKEYNKLSKKQRLEKEFDSRYFSVLTDEMINEIYNYYSKNKFKNLTYQDLCENFVNYGPYSDKISEYNKLILEGDTGKFDIEMDSLVSMDNNLGVFYKLKEYGSNSNVNYIMLYDSEKNEMSVISCTADTSDDKSDFYVWSMILMKLLTQKSYTGQEWLSILSNTVSSPIQVGNWSFKLDMSNGYKFMAIPA